MGRIILSEFVSLDGVIQAPGGKEEDPEENFKHGGWQMPYFDDESEKIMNERIEGLDGLLLGRKTYDIFASYWPQQKGDFLIAEKFNSVPKYVVSSTLKNLSWANSKLLKGGSNLKKEILELKKSFKGNLYIFGSSKLTQSLVKEDLIDEYLIWLYPIILGTGKKLFEGELSKISLKLLDSKLTSSGSVVLTYIK